MKMDIISNIQSQMKPLLSPVQYMNMTRVLSSVLSEVEIVEKSGNVGDMDNYGLLDMFISAKRIEGCSSKTLRYYTKTITRLLDEEKKPLDNVLTDDLRDYLTVYRQSNDLSKTTVDNVRRVLSSFFSWLEDEGYIIKNPMRRIHKIRTPRMVRETFSDEDFEKLCDNCTSLRNLTIIELLISTGMRVGELVNLNISDINFNERECIVFGKGEAQRLVYFDARCKLHLEEYLESRSDTNPALFVSLRKPYRRLGINGVEKMLKKLGDKSEIHNVYPHKFRRTLATNAINKGMHIEQVQRLLGHLQIDTTMQYAMVNQNNVKIAHRKFLG